MKKTLPYFLFGLLVAYFVITNPAHPCYERKADTAFTSEKHWGTICISSVNLYDFGDQNAKEIIVPANLYLPQNIDKPVPAIIMSHGAGGIFRFHHKYKRIFLEQGYAVLIIDHFHPRGKVLDNNFVDITEPMMISDTIAAYNLLKKHPSISGEIGYIGWSKGGIGAVLLKNKRVLEKFKLNKDSFKFLVGIYTFCGFDFNENEIAETPLLLISGKEDTITPAIQCRSFSEKYNGAYNTKYLEIEMAHHGFDNYAFYLGAYIPWQPIITNFSEKCMLKLNKSYKTTNLNGTLKLDSLKNRTDFIKSCTENGAYVIYDSKATRFTEKNLISFIKKNMSQN